METFAAYTGEKAHAYQSDNCTITYSITNEWSGNQQISVSITNDGEETHRNWAIMFDNAGEITNIWNAEVCRNDGKLCVIRNNGDDYDDFSEWALGTNPYVYDYDALEISEEFLRVLFLAIGIQRITYLSFWGR